jgi:hypothetical protein
LIWWIEVQRNVNEVFMRRLMAYFLNVIPTHVCLPLPIILIFCIDEVTPQQQPDLFQHFQPDDKSINLQDCEECDHRRQFIPIKLYHTS